MSSLRIRLCDLSSLWRYSCLALVFLVLSCGQYEYSSPLPGILEVRLRVVNNRPGLTPFGPYNQFGLTLTDLSVFRTGNIRFPIYSDLYAIRRNSKGDWFNCLDTLARDSMKILGQVYAPPGVFRALEMTMSPDPFVLINYGFYSNSINVFYTPPLQALQHFPPTGNQMQIEIQEGRLTRVTVTLDLDSSLVRHTEAFEYKSKFYVSSIKIY